ncbi:MAG: hypothetical protein MUC97_07450 [Bernardetiaceae bacterium]|nr:hypothetical protein [Bernardetiaceae bacterium]
MKTLSLISSLLLLAAHAWAQVRETSAAMSQGTRAALELELPLVDKKVLMSEWGDYVKGFKAKITSGKKAEEMMGDNAVVKTINGNNTIDLYATPSQTTDKAYLTVWFDLGGAFLSRNTHEKEYPEAEKFLLEFGKRMQKVVLDELIKAENAKLKIGQGELSDLERNKAKMEKDNSDFEKQIAELQAKIKQNQDAIQTNINNQATKKTELEALRLKVADLEKMKKQ